MFHGLSRTVSVGVSNPFDQILKLALLSVFPQIQDLFDFPLLFSID